MKLEVPIKVDIDDVTELIHDLQCLQTYKLGINETTVLVSLDAVVGVFADHIRAKRLGKDTNVPTKWIPVSERLPKEEGDYLVTDEAAGIAEVLIDEYMYCDDGAWAWLYSQHAIAWMPLPEPWKGE